MAYINSTRTVVNNVGTDIALAGAGNLFTVSGSLGGTKSLTLSDGFINNGAPEANLIVPLLFPNGHNDLGPSLYLEITVAGVTNPIPVVSNQNGTLLPIPHHEMLEGGSTVYKVVDPNTILNVYYTADYDGSQNPAFVVVGNPLVLSSSTYSIYANGYDEIGYVSRRSIAWGCVKNNNASDSPKVVSQGIVIPNASKATSAETTYSWRSNESSPVYVALVDLPNATSIKFGLGPTDEIKTYNGTYNATDDTWTITNNVASIIFFRVNYDENIIMKTS